MALLIKQRHQIIRIMIQFNHATPFIQFCPVFSISHVSVIVSPILITGWYAFRPFAADSLYHSENWLCFVANRLKEDNSVGTALLLSKRGGYTIIRFFNLPSRIRKRSIRLGIQFITLNQFSLHCLISWVFGRDSLRNWGDPVVNWKINGKYVIRLVRGSCVLLNLSIW
jgi:hypothetical protein